MTLTTQSEGLYPQSLEKYPTVDLECLFDDERNPTEVTIFSADGEDLLTHWLTIDFGHAIALDDAR